MFTGSIPIQICWNHVADGRKDGRFAEVIWLQDGNIGLLTEQNNYSTVTYYIAIKCIKCNVWIILCSLDSRFHSDEYLDLCFWLLRHSEETWHHRVANYSTLWQSSCCGSPWGPSVSCCLWISSLGFFIDRALTVDRMTWLSSPLKLKCWKRRLDFLRDFVAFFNLETLKPDRGLSAVTCQLNTCCKFNAQVSNRFVWEIPVIRGHWWSWEVVPALR